jgi:hypothetical protein
VSDLETIILGTAPPFQRYATAIETEPVGKDLCGQYVRRTLSYLLVPIMTVAILGADNASKYFPRLLTMFDNLVNAIQAELRSGIAIYRYDVAVHPFNCATLYFSSRLQDAVLNGLYMHNMPLYGQLQRWIQERFHNEARNFYQRMGGGAFHPGILAAKRHNLSSHLRPCGVTSQPIESFRLLAFSRHKAQVWPP